MRKLFLFATVAAAGLFASCSSTDDALGEGSNPAVENVDGDENAAIKIGIGNLANMTTRGTGTVGGVGTSSTDAYFVENKWYGQYVNVYMFDHGTFKPTKETSTDTQGMYENRKMVTPGSAENLIVDGVYTGATPAASGEAMNFDASIKYYPLQGNYDFFGYHGDNAVTTTPSLMKTGTNGLEAATGLDDATVMAVPFTIDGSQDLMTTKAMLTGDNKKDLKGSEDYYSAKAARKGVQPVLTFNHLLSRLQFNLFAGTAETAGYGKGYKLDHYNYKATISDAEYQVLVDNANITATDYYAADAGNHTRVIAADIPVSDFDALESDLQNLCEPTFVDGRDIERAIKVEKIEVLSKNTGTMLVAWKDTEGEIVSYRMGILEAAAAPAGGNWTETGTSTGKYYWNNDKVVVPAAVYATIPTAEQAKYVDFSTLTDPEKAATVAFPEYDVPAYKKITWNADQEAQHGLPAAQKNEWVWLSLKERSSYKKLANAAAPVDADVTGYAAASANLTAKETAKNEKKVAMEGDDGNGGFKAALATANSNYSDAKDEYDDQTNGYAAKDALVVIAQGEYDAAVEARDAIADHTSQDWINADAVVTEKQTALTAAITARDALKTALNNAFNAKREAQTNYNNSVTAYNKALAEYNSAKSEEERLRPATLMQETITADVYALLSADGKAKYEPVVNNMNTNLASLSPTAADVQDLNYAGTTVTFNQKKDTNGNTVGVQIGDALLIAPNQYAANGTVTKEPLKMKVKLSQKVPVNWNYPRTYEYKSQEFEVDIPLPVIKNTTTESAFMMNNSYNVNLWVYGFSRIEVHTVINEWKDGGVIGVGED